jgi:SAM-dependent methyltransferase
LHFFVRQKGYIHKNMALLKGFAPMSASTTYHASDGTAYEHFLGRWTGQLAPRLLDFAEFPPDGPVLDVGTGTGSLAVAMAARWPSRRINGIDVAEPYIRYARSRSTAAFLSFEVGDAVCLPFSPGTFCGSAAQLVLNFIPNAGAAVREMRRVTRPGGTVVATVWDFRGGLVYQRIFWDRVAGLDAGAGRARDRLFSTPLAIAGGLAKLFANAGIVEVKSDSITIRMDYENFKDYWRPLLGGQGPIGTYVAELSSDLRARVKDAVRRAYCAGSRDGERSLCATAWAVRGLVP